MDTVSYNNPVTKQSNVGINWRRDKDNASTQNQYETEDQVSQESREVKTI